MIDKLLSPVALELRVGTLIRARLDVGDANNNGKADATLSVQLLGLPEIKHGPVDVDPQAVVALGLDAVQGVWMRLTGGKR